MAKAILFFALAGLIGLLFGLSLSFILTQKCDLTQENNYVKVNGLWMPNGLKSLSKYKQTFICVSLDNITLEEVLKTCQHEVGHEIFARTCEKNMSKCMEVTE